MSARSVAGIALFCACVASVVSAATSTTGTLRGVVTDAAGAPIPAVSIRIHGPALLQDRQAETNSHGEFSLPLLPAGDGYELEATRNGFAPHLTRNVFVRLGRELMLQVVMQPKTSMEIVVESRPAQIDMGNTSSATNITAEQYEAFPTTRDFQYLTSLAPGVTVDRFAAVRPPSGAESDQPSPTIGGATHLENDYLIEGVSTRDVMTGASAAKITMEFVKEVQVMTGEFSAEYGRALGGVVNVVTKSGSNDVSGSVVTYQQDHDWSSHRATSAFRGVDSAPQLGHDKNDWATSLSGPLRRDRLWAFLAYDLRNDRTPLHIVNDFWRVDRDEEIRVRENVHSAKLTFAAAPSNLVTFTLFGNPSTTSGWLYGGNAADPSVALVTQHSGSVNIALRDEAVFKGSRMLEVILGRHRQNLSNDAQSDVPMQGDFLDSSHVFYHGGYPHAGVEKASRDSYGVRGTQVLPNHELKVGADYERNRYDQSLFFVGYWIYRDVVPAAGGEVDALQEVLADQSAYGTNNGVAAFVQDRWTPVPRLTLNLGLRWESQQLSSGQGVAVAAGRNSTGAIIRDRRNSFVMDDAWAPRLGVAWDPAGNGRSRVYASAGRFFESVPVYMNVWSMSGQRQTENYYYSTIAHTHDNWWNPNGKPLNGDWLQFASAEYDSGVVLPGPTPIDPRTKPESELEYNLGYERAAERWAGGARVVRRELHDVLENHFVYGSNGTRSDYVISNIGTGEYASEFTSPSRIYESLELYAQRRLTGRWQVITSFTSSRARGDIDGFYDYAHPNSGSQPHSTPAIEQPKFQRNAYGRLRSDQPYAFKVHSSYELPFGLTLSEGFVYSAGTPYSAFAPRNLTGLPRTYYLTRRGSAGRTPDIYSLDLHGAWRIPHSIGPASASVIVDVFNATDAHRVTQVDQEYFYRGMPGYASWVKPENLNEDGLPKFNPSLPRSQYFGTPNAYQSPRSVQAAFKVEF